MNGWPLCLIIVGCAIGVVLLPIIKISNDRERQRERRGESICIYCKTLAPRFLEKTYLFLIPVFFGDTYENAENFLRTNRKPIMVTEQIPTGMRACFVGIHRCPRCDRQHVLVKDFLRVRNENFIKGR